MPVFLDVDRIAPCTTSAVVIDYSSMNVPSMSKNIVLIGQYILDFRGVLRQELVEGRAVLVIDRTSFRMAFARLLHECWYCS